MNRTKNATRNIVFGMLMKIYQTAMPFVMRTAMIYLLGVNYLGLNSLFTSVLQVLNLAELGVGSAMVFSMYKPIVEGDKESICALMHLYKKYYRIIGFVILALGIAVMPFIPKIIRGEVPDGLNIYILYVLNLGATVLSYWLFAYKNSLLQAHQRNDVTSKVSIITQTIQYLGQFAVLFFFHDYYLYLIVALCTQILANIITALCVDKMYPDYKAVGQLPKEKVDSINQRIKDLFTSKIGGVVVNSADTIVISAFLGLTTLAVYQNYFYFLTSVIGFVTIVFTSCTAGIGNSLIVETKEKNYEDLKKFTFLIAWIAGLCTSCFLCLFQPAMKLWVGEKLMLNFSAVICFCIYYFVYEINQLLNLYKDAAGIWHEDRFRPLITAFANLAMNLILVQIWGIYGVILSTVLSTLFIGMPWLLHNLFTVLFEKKLLYGYVKKLLFYVIVSLIICVLDYSICRVLNLDGWSALIGNGIVCVVITNICFFFVYRKMPEFKQCVSLVDHMTKGKLKLESRLFK